MEIRFCDRCTESIPDADFESGRAATVHGKHYHVACAMQRSLALAGPRSWLTFLLALFAAAISTFLLVVMLGKGEEPDVVTPAEETAIRDGMRAVEQLARDETARRIAESKQEAQTLRKRTGEGLLDQLRTQMDVLKGDVTASDQLAADHLAAHQKRLDRLEAEMEELNRLLREIKAQADRERRRAAAEPVVAESPATVEPEPPGPSPTDPPRPAPPERTAEHDAEVQKWIRRLKDPNENVRFSATLELGRLKDLRAVGPLITVLKGDRDYYVRLGAATALGEIRAVDAVPDLIESLNDRDGLVRQAANEALQMITEVSADQLWKQSKQNAPRPSLSDMSKSERRHMQKLWKKWIEGNEQALRDRLGQPKSA